MADLPQSAQATFFTFAASDDVELQGLLVRPAETHDTVVIHVHGLSGNFYENPFVLTEAKSLSGKGVAVFAFNNRGHDYISDLVRRREDGEESLKGGGAFEVFEECVHDIEGAVALLTSLGYRYLIVQGHSTGCNKVIHYLRQLGSDAAFVGAILLSPCDDVGLVKGSLGDRYAAVLAEARQMVEEGDGEALMPGDPFFGYPMSARTFQEMAREGGSHDVFRYRAGAADSIAGAKCSVQLLAIFGGDEDYLQVPDTTARSFLQALTSKSVTFSRISGAPHSYRGHEGELVSRISSWLEDAR